MNETDDTHGDRFVTHYIRGWNKWIVLDLKYTRDNEVRDWKRRGLPGKQPIWKGTESDADNLAALLNKEHGDNSLVTKVERQHSEYVPWQNKPKRAGIAGLYTVPQFKNCECGAQYRGEKHCAD